MVKKGKVMGMSGSIFAFKNVFMWFASCWFFFNAKIILRRKRSRAEWPDCWRFPWWSWQAVFYCCCLFVLVCSFSSLFITDQIILVCCLALCKMWPRTQREGAELVRLWQAQGRQLVSPYHSSDFYLKIEVRDQRFWKFYNVPFWAVV